MPDQETFTTSRLYVRSTLAEKAQIILEAPQAHRLKTVMRRQEGDTVRLFNGQDGEWKATLSFPDKKTVTATPETQIRPQPAVIQPIHLAFPPLKKDRLDFLIEKAVELGVTDLHPILTERTAVRKINDERLQARITEAAEQCERLDLPVLKPLNKLESFLASIPTDLQIYACLEREEDIPSLGKALNEKTPCLLIGPEGGFSEAEKKRLKNHPAVRPLSLGDLILRTETAAIAGLSHIVLTDP